MVSDRIKYSFVPGIHIAVTRREVGDEDWQGYLAFTEKHLERTKRIFVVSGKVPPSAKQRASLNALFGSLGDRIPRAAIIQSSAVVRASLTALTFFLGKNIKAFSPHQVSEALTYLEISPEQRMTIVDCLGRLCEELGVATPS